MRPDDVAIFVAAVEHGGFSAAARRLGLPRSSISKRMAELEAALGVRLMQRTTRRFALTEAGEHFHRHAAAAMIELASAREAVESLRTEPAGLVVITAATTTLSMGLAAVLAQAARQFPQLRLRVRLSNSYVDLVGEGVDLAIRAHRDPLPDSELVQRQLGVTRNVVVASPAYLEAHPLPSEPADLARLDTIAGSAAVETPTWLFTSTDSGPVSVAIRPRLAVDDPLHALQFAMDGLGVTNLPLAICRPHLEARRLVRLLPGWSAGGAHLTLLTPSRRGQLPGVRAVADAIVAGMKAHLDKAD